MVISPLEMTAATLLGLLACSAGPAAATCRLDPIAELPITMHDGQPFAPAKINGTDVTLRVDTGAFYSTIAASKAAELKLKVTYLAADFEMRWRGTKVTSLAIASLGLSGRVAPNVKFLVLPFDLARDRIGSIGEDVLGGKDLEIDLANGAMRFFRPDDCGGHELAYWHKPNQPWGVLEIDDPRQDLFRTNAIMGFAKVNGRQVRVRFDTAAPYSGLTRSAAARVGIRDAELVENGTTPGADRYTIETWTAPVDSVSIGGETIEHTRMRVLDVKNTDTDLYLGADFFLSHRVYVARSQNKLYFTYNGGPVFNLERVQDLAPSAGER